MKGVRVVSSPFPGPRYRTGYTLWPANFELTEPGPWLDEAEALGVDCVEVPLFCTRLIANFRPVEPALRRFAGAFEGSRLGRTSHAMLTINLMDAPERQGLHEAVARSNIEVSARLGATRMVLHCGLHPGGDAAAMEAAYARQRDSLARLGDAAAAAGVEICLENIWSFDGRETALPSRLAREITAVGHPAVRATLDFAHAALHCAHHGADLMTEVRALAPLTHHLHLNDCFGVTHDMAIALPAEHAAYGSGDLHLPLGWGGLDWERLLTEPAWPDAGQILNQELHPSYWYALPDDVAQLRRLAGVMARRNAGAPAATRI